MRQTKKLDHAVLAAAVLGSLAILNVLGLAFFGRLDLTADKQFTLSKATVAVLDNLREPLTLRAYFSKDLPPPHATQARYVRDLLEEYYTRGHGRVRFEFVDPVAQESSDEKEKKKEVKQDMFGRQIREATAMERELQGLGIPPVQVRVNQDDKLEVKRAYMGLVASYQDKHEAIPVISDTAGLEYDLTTLIRKLVRDKPMAVGFVTGHEGPTLDTDLSKAHGALSELFEVSEVDLAAGPVSTDLAALLVVGPKTAFTDDEKKNLDAYITSGHAAGFFVGPIKPKLSTLEKEDNDPSLQPLLAHYGVTVRDGLVLDAECATINITQNHGFMRVNQPMRYPFMPLPKSLSHHTLTRGLTQVAFPFMAPLQLAKDLPEGVKAEILVQSSAHSWMQPPPFDLNPNQHWEAGGALEAQDLLATVSGPLSPLYPATPAPASSTDPAAAPAGNAPARLFVAGGSAFVQDPFFGKSNETLLLNLVDWLVRDDALLAVRSRGLAAAPLKDLSDRSRTSIKYANIVGLPLAFVGLGLVRWRRREARRDSVSL
jgi:gliding-associated putative ABC transporter substrate-binding component GldG